MRFQILIYNNADAEAAIDGELAGEFRRTHDEIIAELTASGELVDTNELGIDDAVVVRADRADPTRVHSTDGPFSEAREWVGGYYTVECETRERAIAIAGRFVEARFSPVEVRRLIH
ncbi:YciI family protein [Leifsonia poae]|uniref:YciI family protein n=1 Tax=Leifsonia poae TaxID=110933 RepID=UPI001CBB9ECA|nr:YciI family protein [Leifsonia poae]